MPGMPKGVFGGNDIFSGGFPGGGATGGVFPGGGATGGGFPGGGMPGMGAGMPGGPGMSGGAGGTVFSSSPFIPGTMIKMPQGLSSSQVMENFDPDALGIKLPANVNKEDFSKIFQGGVAFDAMTQDIIKGMNPGMFGPMNNPYQMSQQAGLSMDNLGNFLVTASEGAPGNSYIVKAKSLEAEGKFKEAAEVLKDSSAPFAQFPDALVHAYRAELEAKAGNTQVAVDAIEKCLAMSPFDDKLYDKAGKFYKEAGIEGPKVFCNGLKPQFDVQPFIKEGRTLVPFRALAETLGAQVGWNGDTQTVTVIKGGKVISMTVGENTATVDGNPVTLDVPPTIVDGRTVVPLRFIGESLDADVSYDGDTEIIKVLPTAAESTAGTETAGQ